MVVTMAAVTRGYGHSLTSKGQANFIKVLFFLQGTKNLPRLEPGSLKESSLQYQVFPTGVQHICISQSFWTT